MSDASHRFDNAKRRRSGNHDRQRQLTPAYVLEPVRQLLHGIDLDPCTESNNPTGARRFYALPDNGLERSWEGKSVFCNPPYGEARNRWVARCIASGVVRPTVLLIPAHTETRTAQLAPRRRAKLGMRLGGGQGGQSETGGAGVRTVAADGVALEDASLRRLKHRHLRRRGGQGAARVREVGGDDP